MVHAQSESRQAQGLTATKIFFAVFAAIMCAGLVLLVPEAALGLVLLAACIMGVVFVVKLFFWLVEQAMTSASRNGRRR